MGVCLSMYPNPVPKGENVTVTFRTQHFYNDKWVCLNRNPNIFVMKCHIVNETCKQDIDKNNVVAGYYYAFLEGTVDCATINVMPTSAQAKSREVKLETLY